jgi:RNA polymerase sigma-70 factor (ECF subfamily)
LPRTPPTHTPPDDPAARDPDAALVAALRTGDEEAFATLVARYHGTLKRIARMYVATDAAAEDVVAETWLAVVDGLDRFQQRSAFRTWLFQIASNRAKTRGVRERRSVPFASVGPGGEDDEPTIPADRFQRDGDAAPGAWATPPRPWEDPERRLASLEARDRLRAAIAALPERQQAVLTLRDVEGLDADEVAELLNVSPGNQRVLLHRARAKVRAALEEYFEDDGPP